MINVLYYWRLYILFFWQLYWREVDDMKNNAVCVTGVLGVSQWFQRIILLCSLNVVAPVGLNHTYARCYPIPF